MQDSGMYEFPQGMGTLSEPPSGRWSDFPSPHMQLTPVGQPPLHWKQDSHQTPTPTPTGSLAAPTSAAAAANRAADAAAQAASTALASARSRMQQLSATGPSSSNSGGAAATIDEEEGTSAGGGRARRRSTGRAAAAAAAEAGGKPGKGLRHFSMQVCNKVKSKGTTTYNEVADELVAEMKAGALGDDSGYDEKNIRRRVYDAINVLMALDIIAKEKKAIIWKGLPAPREGGDGGASGGASSAVARVEAERRAAAGAVERKMARLVELVERNAALQSLMERNRERGGPSGSGTALELPFILVQAKQDATVEVQISEDMREVQFDFYNSPFEIHDDSYVLRAMAAEKARVADEAAAAADGRGRKGLYSNGCSRGPR